MSTTDRKSLLRWIIDFYGEGVPFVVFGRIIRHSRKAVWLRVAFFVFSLYGVISIAPQFQELLRAPNWQTAPTEVKIIFITGFAIYLVFAVSIFLVEAKRLNNSAEVRLRYRALLFMAAAVLIGASPFILIGLAFWYVNQEFVPLPVRISANSFLVTLIVLNLLNWLNGSVGRNYSEREGAGGKGALPRIT